MGTLASGSIDLKSLQIAGEPNKYITMIDERGIIIHPENTELDSDNPTNYSIQLDGEGLQILENNIPIANYGSNVCVGNTNGFHIVMTGSELGFFQGEDKVAYITNNQLYISKSVVLQQMDVGKLVDLNNEGGLWSWKVHKNANGLNNLNLKWIG